MTRTKKRAFLFGAILVPVLIVVLYLRGSREFPRVIQLPNGSQLTILGVSYGTNHGSAGFLPKRMVDRLPQWFVHKFRITPRYTVSTPEPALVIWFDWPVRNAAARRVHLFSTFEDPAGHEVAGQHLFQGGFGSPLVEACTFEAFPRRDPTIRLHLYDVDAQAQPIRVASVEFANPAFHEYPVWRAGPDTVRSVSGDFEATIEKLVVCENTNLLPVPFAHEYGPNWLACETAFRARYRGENATNWVIKRIELADATGNRLLEMQRWGIPANGGYFGHPFRFAPALWPDGSAWKLRAEYARLPGAEFSPDELVTFKNVPVPAARACSYGNWLTNLHGMTLTLDGVAGVMATLTNTSMISYQNNVEEIVATLEPAIVGMNLTIARIVSDNGKSIDPGGYNPAAPGSTKYQFGVTFPRGATTVDITFAVHQSRFLEFMVKPELVAANLSQSGRGAGK